MIIGIEGPAGAGKTTMARTVAPEIGTVVIEGGAWYRALTHLARQENVDLHDTNRLMALAEQLDLSVKPEPSGDTQVFVKGQDVTEQIYSDEIAGSVAIVAQQLDVRKIIETQIVNTVRAREQVIIVGRHLKRALPEAAILRLKIEGNEAERRHVLRAGEVAQSVLARNTLDAATAQALGTAVDGVVELDVTNMTPEVQADALRQFIDQAYPVNK